MTERSAYDPKAPRAAAAPAEEAQVAPVEEEALEPSSATDGQEEPQDEAHGDDPGIEVPDGTVEEVVEWAGTDHERIRAALAAEQAGKQRKGVLALADRLEG